MNIIFINKLSTTCIALFIISCSKPPCNCDFISRQQIEIKFINQQEQNLIFGPTALYRIDSIQVLKQKSNFGINNSSVQKGVIDSNNVKFDFYVPAVKSYIYYDQQTQQDSLEIKWLTNTGNCCGNLQEYYTVDSVKINNAYIKASNGVYYFIK